MVIVPPPPFQSIYHEQKMANNASTTDATWHGFTPVHKTFLYSKLIHEIHYLSISYRCVKDEFHWTTTSEPSSRSHPTQEMEPESCKGSTVLGHVQCSTGSSHVSRTVSITDIVPLLIVYISDLIINWQDSTCRHQRLTFRLAQTCSTCC